MPLIRWEPAAELGTIQNEMNRLFNTLVEQSTPAGRSGGRRWLPAIDIVETADQYVLHADLPGLSDGDVTVQMEDNVLTISGERKLAQERHEENYYRLERASGPFSRSLTLPEGIDASRILAHFDRGVLEVHVPKPERKKPQKVQITVGDSEPGAIEGTASDSGKEVGEEHVAALN